MRKPVRRGAPKREWIRPELKRLDASDAEAGLIDYFVASS
jgi:hypothetical protein